MIRLLSELKWFMNIVGRIVILTMFFQICISIKYQAKLNECWRMSEVTNFLKACETLDCVKVKDYLEKGVDVDISTKEPGTCFVNVCENLHAQRAKTPNYQPTVGNFVGV